MVMVKFSSRLEDDYRFQLPNLGLIVCLEGNALNCPRRGQ